MAIVVTRVICPLEVILRKTREKTNVVAQTTRMSTIAYLTFSWLKSVAVYAFGIHKSTLASVLFSVFSKRQGGAAMNFYLWFNPALFWLTVWAEAARAVRAREAVDRVEGVPGHRVIHVRFGRR